MPNVQVHDFNPGIGSNGLFWIVQVPDDAVTITNNTLTIALQNVPVVDQIRFPLGTGGSLGIAGAPATVSFSITYTKSEPSRIVRPTSTDPLSPFAWAGEMWTATNSGTFSVTYNDGSFSAQGSFGSSGNFGEMGTERNGSFVHEDEVLKPAAGKAATVLAQPLSNLAAARTATPGASSPKFKGIVPLEYLLR